MDTNFDKKIFIKNFRENCNKIQIKKISKGETVTSYIEKRNQICIILSGEVDLIRTLLTNRFALRNFILLHNPCAKI